MLESPESEQIPETLEYAAQTSAGSKASTLVLLIVVAVGAVLIGLQIPTRQPFVRTDSWENWRAFGLRIVRDVLISIAFLCVALGVAIGFPRLGRWFEKIVFRSRLSLFLVTCALFSTLTSALFNYVVLDHNPYIQDEIAMEFQAKVLAKGRLTAPAPKLPESFDCEDLMVRDGKWYGKYFIGQSICLVPGEWIGVPWLVHPILGGLAIWLTYALGAALWSPRLGRLGALLMTVSTYRLVIFAMFLGHASSLMMLGLFALAVVRLVRDPSRWCWALTGGLALGLAVNSRPLTAFSIGGAIALVAAMFFPWRKLTLKSALAFAGGLGVFAAVFFAYNKVLTGDATLAPFSQWSKTDRLGFGPDVGLEYWWDRDKGHTLRKGLFKDGYFNLEALRLSEIGWGGIVFVLMAIPLFVQRYWKLGLALAAPFVAVAVAHVFHVSHGVLLHQARYWSESMPMMLLLVAVGLMFARWWLPQLCRWLGTDAPVDRGRSAFWTWCLLMVAWSVLFSSYPLIKESMGDFLGQSPKVRDQARLQHIDNALVFVKTGYYRTHLRGGPEDLYPCGFMLNDPDLKGPVVYARDLGPERNKALIAQYPGRALYRIDPNVGAGARFEPYAPTTQSASADQSGSTR